MQNEKCKFRERICLHEGEDIAMTILEKISIDPKVMHGKPCIKGTRIPV